MHEQQQHFTNDLFSSFAIAILNFAPEKKDLFLPAQLSPRYKKDKITCPPELVRPALQRRPALLLRLVAPIGAVGVSVANPGAVDAVGSGEALELGPGAGGGGRGRRGLAHRSVRRREGGGSGGGGRAVLFEERKRKYNFFNASFAK